ncbi:MAG: hypothetical protein WB586_16465 [Chthoniobacterales bacterium]
MDTAKAQQSAKPAGCNINAQAQVAALRALPWRQDLQWVSMS